MSAGLLLSAFEASQKKVTQNLNMKRAGSNDFDIPNPNMRKCRPGKRKRSIGEKVPKSARKMLHEKIEFAQ